MSNFAIWRATSLNRTAPLELGIRQDVSKFTSLKIEENVSKWRKVRFLLATPVNAQGKRPFSLSFKLCILIPDKFNVRRSNHCMSTTFALGRRVWCSVTENNCIERHFYHMELFLFKVIFHLIGTIGRQKFPYVLKALVQKRE